MLKYKKYLITGIAVAALYIGICTALKHEIDFVMGAVLVGVSIMFVSSSSIRSLKKEFGEMKYQVAEYISKKDANDFIKKHSGLSERVTSPALKEIIKINIASAYIDIHKDEEAKAVLSDIDHTKMDKKNYVHLAVNKIILMYRLNLWSDGDALYDEVFVSNGKRTQGVLFDIVKILREHREDKQSGMAMLDELAKKPGNEMYVNVVAMSKGLLLRGE